MCKRAAGSMDLSEKWPLEEGTWLSHAGIHHFANTRGGMAALMSLIYGVLFNSCTHCVNLAILRTCPVLFVCSKAARWRGEEGTLESGRSGFRSWISYL